MNPKLQLLGFSLLAVLVVHPFSLAQETEPARDSDSRILQTVTVTSQQREQNIQDVPISLQVVTSDQIDTLAADDIGDLDMFIPGLSVSNNSPTQPRFSIRGISTSDFGVGTDPAVGIYVDGIYAARSGASLLAFNDVERIEVIKGPQGTLFGRNSAAGAVSITTRKPNKEFEASGGLRLGEFGKQRVEGLLNLPAAENVFVRLNAVVNKRDGLYKDSVTGEDYKREDSWALKAALRVDISENTVLDVSITHDELDQDARPAIGIVAIPDAPNTPPTTVNTANYLNPFTVPIRNDAVGNGERRKLDEFVISVSHRLPRYTITSITAYRTFDTNNREDEDGTNRKDLYFDTNNVESNKSFYQELRFAGNTDQIDWIAGASYFDEDADQRSDTYTYTDSINTLVKNSTPLGPIFTNLENQLLRPLQRSETVLGHSWSEDMINTGSYQAFALFADVIFQYSDKMNVTFGVRYTEDKKAFSWLNDGRSAPTLDAALKSLHDDGVLAQAQVTPENFQFDAIFDLTSGVSGVPCDNGVRIGEGVKCELKDSWSNLSPRLVMDYQFNDDLMAYFSIARGYKAGGFNSVEVGSRFENEEVSNIEVGVKSLDIARNLRYSGSLFRYVYDDKQAVRLVNSVPGSNVPQYLVETSDEKGLGIDLLVEWVPSDDWFLYYNAQYIDLTFKRRVTRAGVDLSGEPTGEPNWSFVLGGSYAYDLVKNGEIEVNLSHAYTGKRRCNRESSQQGDCASYGTFAVGQEQSRTDLRGYWVSSDQRVKAGLFISNLFDNQYVSGINNITTSNLGTPFVGLTEPQTWGIDVKWKY